MFASHSWPRWGNARIQEVLRAQRDAYANLNNQALHYANQGVTINEIHNVYEVPKSLQQQWAARSYHGDVQNNSRAVINRFLGFYDGNPVNLHPAVAAGFGAAVRRDDGRFREDHGQGQGADRPGQIPRGVRDPQQAGVRGAAESGRPAACWPTPTSNSATRPRAPACATAILQGALRAAQRPARRHARTQLPDRTWSAPCRPKCGSTSSASAWTDGGNSAGWLRSVRPDILSRRNFALTRS